MILHETIGYRFIRKWLTEKSFEPFPFQEETWAAIDKGESGLVNAPTGFGKTFAVFLGTLIRFINEHPDDYRQRQGNGLQLLWITPLRALGKDIARAMEAVLSETGIPWKIAVRNGDTPVSERQRQKKQMPEVLIITPESLHLLFAQKGYASLLSSVSVVAVDEWHELLGSKRGVQTELALSHLLPLLKTNRPSVFAISATIGNLEEAQQVILSPLKEKGILIQAGFKKRFEIRSIFPDEIEKYPWAGHLGIRLIDKIIPIIRNSTTTLLFINTRGMTERWYQAILEAAPDLAGAIAIHHGSIEQELRVWVEESLHKASLKVVVCTASLDLGVDFRPVETVIQVGSPKGVARFLQRAGRSGHQPGAVSQIYFLPTHSLELVEAAALQQAIEEDVVEPREPLLLCYDTLVQWLCTLAVSDGFWETEVLREVRATHCFREISDSEWLQMLQLISSGGKALQQYDEFRKVEIIDGLYKMTARRIAMRHRMHIGTIVSDAMLKVKFVSGAYLGVIEEYFISRLTPGEVFTLAGKNLELVMIKDMTVLVRKSAAKKSIVPSWMGGRMPLSANLGNQLRKQFTDAGTGKSARREIKVLQPLFDLQSELSYVPGAGELLIEQIETKDGFHLFVFPFEGRLVHEAMAAILAYRISRIRPISFSIAMNDYGFELLSDQPIPVDDTNVYELFSTENLFADIQRSVNSTEMAKRKFRDIAVIGGLIFQGFPGEHKKARHLQSGASLLFNVFLQYDPDNLLMRQAFREVYDQQMEEQRLRNMLERISRSRIVLKFPKQLTPFCFPIKADSLRETLSSEKLEDRLKKMQLQLYG